MLILVYFFKMTLWEQLWNDDVTVDSVCHVIKCILHNIKLTSVSLNHEAF
jgi:hypothetical protein